MTDSRPYLLGRPTGDGECPVCGDDGEIVVVRLAANPFSGVPVPDPESEDIVPCPRCSQTTREAA